MQFTFTVSVELERSEGKFASRDELSEQIIESISSADPGSLYGDNGGIYEVVDWEVEDTSKS